MYTNLLHLLPQYETTAEKLALIQANLSPAQYHCLMVWLSTNFNVEELVYNQQTGLVWDDDGVIDELTNQESQTVLTTALAELNHGGN